MDGIARSSGYLQFLKENEIFNVSGYYSIDIRLCKIIASIDVTHQLIKQLGRYTYIR